MKTRLYLDKRSSKQSGATGGKPLHPVKISISINGRTAYIGTGVDLPESEWSEDLGQPKKAVLAIKLAEKKLTVDKALESLRVEGRLKGQPVSAVKDMAVARIKRDEEGRNRERPVIACLDELIGNIGREGTRAVYEATKGKLEKYHGFEPWMTFADITSGWLEGFEAYLAKTSPSANARSIHLRNIRALFNFAIKNRYTAATYPFREFKIKSEPTKDRSMTVEELRAFLSAPCSESQGRYRDLFLLSFLCCGINLEDLLSIKELKGGRIETLRIKTGQPISIGVQPEAMEIINRYKGKDRLIGIYGKGMNYKNFRHRVNNALKTIGMIYNPRTWKWEGKALHPDISFYWARYSWATIAAELDIAERTIGAAMGHSTSKTVTSIYTRVDMRKKIDAANRKVIDEVLHG